MEPRKVARRGRMIYECPDCGYQMEMTETHTSGTAEDAPGGTGPDAEDEEDIEDEEDEENGDEDKEESAG